MFCRLVGFATKTNWIRQVVLPNIFCVTLTHLHLSGMDSSGGPKEARHVSYFDSTREPKAGTSGFWCLPLRKAKHSLSTAVTGRQAHLPHGRSQAAAPRLCPSPPPLQPPGSAAAGSGGLLSRPAPESQHVAVPALRSPHGAAVEQGRRLRGLPRGAAAVKRAAGGRGQGHGRRGHLPGL